MERGRGGGGEQALVFNRLQTLVLKVVGRFGNKYVELLIA